MARHDKPPRRPRVASVCVAYAGLTVADCGFCQALPSSSRAGVARGTRRVGSRTMIRAGPAVNAGGDAAAGPRAMRRGGLRQPRQPGCPAEVPVAGQPAPVERTRRWGAAGHRRRRGAPGGRCPGRGPRRPVVSGHGRGDRRPAGPRGGLRRRRRRAPATRTPPRGARRREAGALATASPGPPSTTASAIAAPAAARTPPSAAAPDRKLTSSIRAYIARFSLAQSWSLPSHPT